ncbi:hypothetical protein BC833DRAFT_600171 [Globomyces pollinis-pini]|nr:hypothetical protein BC833DRAFT_600171 [Globomyces pollinis-pini]
MSKKAQEYEQPPAYSEDTPTSSYTEAPQPTPQPIPTPISVFATVHSTTTHHTFQTHMQHAQPTVSQSPDVFKPLKTVALIIFVPAVLFVIGYALYEVVTPPYSFTPAAQMADYAIIAQFSKVAFISQFSYFSIVSQISVCSVFSMFSVCSFASLFAVFSWYSAFSIVSVKLACFTCKILHEEPITDPHINLLQRNQ